MLVAQFNFGLSPFRFEPSSYLDRLNAAVAPAKPDMGVCMHVCAYVYVYVRTYSSEELFGI